MVGGKNARACKPIFYGDDLTLNSSDEGGELDSTAKKKVF